MNGQPDHTPARHDNLERLHARVAELGREIAQRQLETGSIVQAADQHYRLLFEHVVSWLSTVA